MQNDQNFCFQEIISQKSSPPTVFSIDFEIKARCDGGQTLLNDRPQLFAIGG